ncbi:bifunctional phosphoribosylaminoimidazolecarboxamide formyltransferase/IMP cyclohydrolase [Anaerosalibacter bizertensis]|uniref:bifunctional phosphoribosylaminoimidazolecarboxamide formyltransferase/IMP cyclohydrolase n=1 Tax=Anaerosalibacter bizertensis TaxID=932217 RepID=UPI001C0ED9AC|nr:bifunctional phosphoribosylaminoimidazolecarboxamide formyltransferase/IMP cyclohydrolase [Anaerosalibacter bizertensis]MBU5292928.1 bifunctional phosphoribosylaminoimidazolecarboxamide formyltransferase/IMP cyclohydrolase [Anaerosalibacter bizertensis]
MKRALISVWDKTGIVDFAKELVDLGWEIISTGGTKKTLKEAGLEVIDISDITGFPEAFDGRVKTLHPNIHGGLLHIRENEEHVKTLEKLDMKPIDLVVNNLYPFKQTVLKEGVTHEEVIENIDIGGPSMIRAAAKNYKYVTVIVDPKDYEKVIDELRENEETSLETRGSLARKVFQYTSNYDSLIANYFNEKDNIDFPDTITLTFEEKVGLRYGENPHQKAAFYREVGDNRGTLTGATQLHGKELSFNNINDTNGALEILKEFEEPTVVAVKHANPCGIGSGENLLEAYKKAYESDKVSIFGGIIAANREVDEEVAEMINSIFIEVVVAPSYTENALEILKSKKNIRLLELKDIMKNDYKSYDVKKVLGGILVQERDTVLLKEDLEVVTKRKPTEEELEELMFAWKAVKNVKSNSVVLVKDKGTIGIGMGQTNRIWAVEQAIEHSGEKVKGSVLASDGFFPFGDSVEALAKAGVTAVIQPGGSIRDEESIKAADENNMAMVFTHMRHFKH